MFQVPCDVKVTFSFTNPVVGLCKIPLWGYFVGMNCSHTGDPSYLLNRGIRHLERSSHLSSIHGGLSPRERIITCHYPGRLSPPREDYHLSTCRFWIITLVWRERWVTCWPYLEYFIPYPFSPPSFFLVICFQPKGYGLGVLTTTYCHFRLGVPLGWTAQPMHVKRVHLSYMKLK